MEGLDMDTGFPVYRGKLEYHCLVCGTYFSDAQLQYACPDCGGVLLLGDRNFAQLKSRSGAQWRALFEGRAATRIQPLRGIFRFYELIAPVLEAEDILYLGEGQTPVIPASPELTRQLGLLFSFKNEGQNPSASFKDRGMACAYSILRAMSRKHDWQEVLALCASTGDTSAAAALYGAYVGAPVKTAVLLPQGKVTPQQLSQPLGSGATVLEMPGVFDDCMKVVEFLAANYRVALLNSKNSWRILGQESYAYELAQWHGWNLEHCNVFVPIGNAGNVSAIMSGFLKLKELEIINKLPHLFGVQSEHADPLWRYYEQPPDGRKYAPVQVRPSVAQAAMIGNPVSFARVRHLAEKYEQAGGVFKVLRVTEQAIMDATVLANRHGHIVCTQGGECLAGLLEARRLNLIRPDSLSILNSTAHILKFANFQEQYFSDSLGAAYGIKARSEYVNAPQLLFTRDERDSMGNDFIMRAAEAVAQRLDLRKCLSLP
jgi:threonine synthase